MDDTTINFVRYCRAYLEQQCGLTEKQGKILVCDPLLGPPMDKVKSKWAWEELEPGDDPDDYLLNFRFDSPKMESINNLLQKFASNYNVREPHILDYLHSIGHPLGRKSNAKSKGIFRIKIIFKILFTLIALYQLYIDTASMISGEIVIIIPIVSTFAILALIGLWQRQFYGVFFMSGFFLIIFVDYTFSLIFEWSESAIIQWVLMVALLFPIYFLLRNEYDHERDSKFDKWILKYLLKSKDD